MSYTMLLGFPFDQRQLVLSVLELLAKNNFSNWENIFFQLERLNSAFSFIEAFALYLSLRPVTVGSGRAELSYEILFTRYERPCRGPSAAFSP